jgi:formate dehydrogenase maturation protein FdhE
MKQMQFEMQQEQMQQMQQMQQEQEQMQFLLQQRLDDIQAMKNEYRENAMQQQQMLQQQLVQQYAPKSEATKQCPVCGEILDANAGFCAECGHRF